MVRNPCKQYTQRAKNFYETILNIEMTTQFIAETNETLTFFPYNPEVIQATSGRVTGVLTESENNFPSRREQSYTSMQAPIFNLF